MVTTTVASIFLVHDDGTLTQFKPVVLEDTEPVTGTRTRRRTKRPCPICGEKFFGPGMGSHMKACKKNNGS